MTTPGPRRRRTPRPAYPDARRRALRAYALVYSSLAFRHVKGLPPVDKDIEDAVRVLFAPRQRNSTHQKNSKKAPDDFPFGVPERSTKTRGYSASRDVLWVHPERFFQRRGSSAQLADVDINRLFEDDRFLWPRLRLFVGCKRWSTWKASPLPVNKRGEVSEEVRDAYWRIVPPHGRARVDYRGVLLVGHDPNRLRGVYVIGVRRQEWLVDAAPEERLTWLLQPPDLVEPFLPEVNPDEPLLWLSPPPSVAEFRERAGAFRNVSRALLRWHATLIADPWYWRHWVPDQIPWDHVEELFFRARRYTACFLSYADTIAEVAAELRLGLHQARTYGTGFLHRQLLVISPLSLAETEQAIGQVLAKEPDLCAGLRFMVVDGRTIEALARRYPWVWELELAGMKQQPPGRPRSVPDLFDYRVWLLKEEGHTTQALAALQALFAVPGLSMSPGTLSYLLDVLFDLEADAPWALMRDLARALRHQWAYAGHVNPDTIEDDQERSKILLQWDWLTRILPYRLREKIRADAWATLPDVRTPEWHGLVRLLRGWRVLGAKTVAAEFADGIHTKLCELGVSTEVVDAARSASGTHQRGLPSPDGRLEQPHT